MIRPGYAIEYDAIDPRELRHSLEVKTIRAYSLLARSTARPDMKRQLAGLDCRNQFRSTGRWTGAVIIAAPKVIQEF